MNADSGVVMELPGALVLTKTILCIHDFIWTEILTCRIGADTFMKQVIHTDKAPAAAGPYSQAVRAGDFLFVSGQIALVPGTKELCGSGAGEQAARALENLKAIVEAAGLTMKDVVKVTVILADIKDFGEVNEVYSNYFNGECPARAAFQGGGLPLGALVEIEAVAYHGKE